jgi:hypothetical protein
MYPHKDKPQDNWSYFTAWGFRELCKRLNHEGRSVSSLAIVGIGSGVEGILAGRLFQPELTGLIISDIDHIVVSGAYHNIFINTTVNTGLDIIHLIGSLCEPIAKVGLDVDLIYGNIPNLPAAGDEDLSLGAEKGTFIMPQVYEGYEPPEEFIGWALGSQFAYLQSAKKVLPVGGSVVTALGGRMPIDIVERLFTACDLKLEDIVVGFKEQTEALIDFQGYHRLEQEYGVSFEFYLYQQAMDLMEQEGIKNPSTGISSRELKTLLEPFRVSAGEALVLYEQKVPVGHTVNILRGVK